MTNNMVTGHCHVTYHNISETMTTVNICSTSVFRAPELVPQERRVDVHADAPVLERHVVPQRGPRVARPRSGAADGMR